MLTRLSRTPLARLTRGLFGPLCVNAGESGAILANQTRPAKDLAREGSFKPTKGRDKTNLKRFIDDELEEAEYGSVYRADLPGRDRINRQ